MAISSLTRFTVPIAGDQSPNAQGLLMPKLAFRFRVTFENFGISTPRTELTKQVMNFSRPNVSMENIELNVYNSKVNLAGKYTWDPISVTIRDDSLGVVSRLIGEQMQKQFDFFEQASAASGIDYKFVTRCEMLDGANGANEPTVLETWEMYGCYIESSNYNELDYATNDAMNIGLSIRFDNALQKPDGSGVGAVVPRLSGVSATG